ncbi:hypothetical protein LguiB_015443 [Lonicera macranthoides]
MIKSSIEDWFFLSLSTTMRKHTSCPYEDTFSTPEGFALNSQFKLLAHVRILFLHSKALL